MGFDRALTKAALDVGLEVAAAGGDKTALASRLRDVVSATEAKGRTRAHVARIWVDPPAHTRSVLAWAAENQGLDRSGTFLHFGALLVTTPFVVPVAIGAARHVSKTGGVDPEKLTRELAKHLGDDAAATSGIANVLSTLRAIGLFLGTEEHPLGTRPAVPKALAGWFTHVLLVTRRTLRIDVEEWRTAPEMKLLGAKPTGGILGYPRLDIGGAAGHTVASERD